MTVQCKSARHTRWHMNYTIHSVIHVNTTNQFASVTLLLFLAEGWQ